MQLRQSRRIVQQALKLGIDLGMRDADVHVALSARTGPAPNLAEHFAVQFINPGEREGGLTARGLGYEVFHDCFMDVFGFKDAELRAVGDVAGDQAGSVNRRFVGNGVPRVH